jgi:mono/diheme cytochrome c family protein
MLKPFLFASAVVLFAISASTAQGPAPEDSTSAAASGQKNPVKPTAESRARAKVIYSQDCALCHGANGDGKGDLATAMGVSTGDWTDGKKLSAKSDEELFKVIRAGKDKMPPEGADRAKDNEVWGLVLYIRDLGKHSAANN